MTAALSLSRSDTRRSFDEIRAREYSRLDIADQAYLDFTGSALYSERQIDLHAERMRRSILGNPHSENGPSLFSTALIHKAKARLLQFLDASLDDYSVVFTANTSAAIKLVAESFPFSEDAGLVLAADNHNSVNGIREFARSRGGRVTYIGLDGELRLQRERIPAGHGLFAFPAQSNFSGVKHPLTLVRDAHRLGYQVLLDAAAFLPTNRLSLRKIPADFVVMSVYKISGFPTGVGALVARKQSLAMLMRPWFAGGTVAYVSVQLGRHRLLDRNGEGFEDGTPAFLDIAAVCDALDFIDEIGIEEINAHVMNHTARFTEEVALLRNLCGRPLVQIYGPASDVARGATVAFNVVGSDGNVIPFSRVVERARNEGVSLRGGCFCNPGASERAFGFPADAASRCLDLLDAGEFSFENFSHCLGPGIPVGAVRASFGIPTNHRDINRALAVIASFAG
ncbi:MAG TPA: aminotransferase class V-fold PLP-dependent enzyme [Gemmatimonadaceae bacterium]